jgi:septum site-determining protein MinC|tara:strand:+ start:17179 stop:17910 length:732 start_codon:yes stop_codon:yes gene_type:complete
MANVCFQMKGTAFTAVVMDLYDYSAELFLAQLKQKINTAPQFFNASPLVLNLASFEGELKDEQLEKIVADCRDMGLQPIACRGAALELKYTVMGLGLASLPSAKTRSTDIQAEPAQSKSAKVEPVKQSVEKELGYRPSKVITKPVRSGQQIYAEGCDLIVMAAVSQGAEVLADGHVHVYGPLRGRALAGVKGDTNARVFCRQMEAELVSIAGYFILNEKLRELCWKEAAQVFLDGESIQVEAI